MTGTGECNQNGARGLAQGEKVQKKSAVWWWFLLVSFLDALV